MRVLPGPTRSNQALAWSPDGRWLVAGGSGDGVMAWDVDTGAPGVRVLLNGHGGHLMQFCPRTGRLYVAFQTDGLWTWDPATGAETRPPWTVDGWTRFQGLAISPEGQFVVVTYYRIQPGPARTTVAGYAVAEDGTMTEAWSRADNSGVGVFTFRGDTGELFGLGRHVNGALRFEWARPEAGEVVGSFAVPREGGRVTAWALAPDGARVAWLTDRGLYLRRLTDPATLELPAADGEVRRGLAFAPSGQMLAYTSGNTVRLIDAATFAEARALDLGIGRVRAVAFSPDGLRAAVSGEGGRGWVTVFDVE